MNHKPKAKTCPVCGMTRDRWRGDRGKGIKESGKVYCCEGCAIGESCLCHF